MKPSPLSRILQSISLLFSISALTASAQNGTWTNNSPAGNWSDPLNWLNGIVADGPSAIAAFNTIDVTNAITVTIDDAARTNSHLIFSDTDTNTPFSWTVAGIGLTAPTNLSVTVSNLGPNQTATISASIIDILDGGFLTVPSVFTKLGADVLVLNGANTYSGGTVISNGTLRIGADGNLGTAGTPITINGGRLHTTAAVVLAGRNVTLGANGATVQTTAGGANAGSQFTGIVSGPGTLIKTGANNLRIGTATANDYAGGTIVQQGSVQVLNGGLQPLGTGTVSFTNGTTFFGPGSGGTVVLSNLINLPTGATVSLDPVGNANNTNGFVLNGPIIGSGSFNKNGGGWVSLGGDNSGFTGTITMAGNPNAGFAFTSTNSGSASAVWNFAVAGTATRVAHMRFDAAGGTIKFGSMQGILPITKNADAGNVVLEVGALGLNDTYSGPIGTNTTGGAFTPTAGGTIGLTKVGAGTMTLSGANTYRGSTIIRNGAIAIDSEGRLGANPAALTADQLTLDGGALSNTASFAIANANRGVTLGTAGGTIKPAPGTTLTISNVIAGTGSLTLDGAGTLTPTAANTYSGRTILKSGTLSLSAETALGNTPGGFTANQLTLDGGTLSGNTTFTIDDAFRGVTLGAGGGTINPAGSSTLTIATPIAGAGNLIKTGSSGTLTLNAANGYTGSTLINQGTLKLGASGSIANSPLISLPSGSTYDVSSVSGYTLASGQTLIGNGNVVGSVTAASGSTLIAGSSIGALNISGNLTLSGGATNLVEVNSLTNDTIIVGGNMALSGANTVALTLFGFPPSQRPVFKYGGTVTSGSAANLTLLGFPPSRLTAALVDNPGNKSIDLQVSGTAGNLTWSGTTDSNWDLLTTNWLNNGVTPDKFLGADNVTFNAVGAAVSNINLTTSLQPGTVTVNATTDYSFSGSGKITGAANLSKANSGTLTLLTKNDYVGPSTISSGTVRVGNGVTSGSLGSGDITDNAALVFNLPDSVTNSGAINGSGSLSLQAGTLSLAANGALTGSTTIGSGSTLRVGTGGASGAIGSGSVQNSGALVFLRSGAVTNGSLNGNGSLSITGSVTVAVAADGNFSGPTTINAGVLQIGVGGTAGSLGVAGVTLANNGGLAFSRSDTVTNGVTLSGSGRLIQQGPGVVILTNTIAHNGQTVINAGTLQIGDGVNTNGTLGLGAVTDNGILVFNRPDTNFIVITNLISGTGSLVINTGLVTINPVAAPYNTYGGGTIVSNATLAFGTDALLSSAPMIGAVGTGPITLHGGTVALYNSAANVDDNVLVYAFESDLVVPTGQSGTFLEARSMRAQSAKGVGYSGNVSGGGTLNFRAIGNRSDVSGDWSGFTGQVNITNFNGAGSFRSSTGVPNGTVHIYAGAAVGVWSENFAANANSTIRIGALQGDGQLATGTDNQTANGATWVVGSKNTDNTFDGVIINQGNAASNVRKVGTGRWTLTGVSTYTGTTTVSNGVLSLSTNGPGADASIAGSALITIATPGILDVSALSDSTLHLGTQILGGNGTLRGNLEVNGTLSPGFSIGTITVTNTATLNGIYNVEINRAAAQTADRLVARNIVINNSTLVITNLGALSTGDTFQILQANGGTISGSFASISGAVPPGGSWDTSNLNANGTITAILPPSPVLTNVLSNSGTTIDFSWGAEYIGWRLYVQTNTLSVGLSSNWAPIDGTQFGTTWTEPIGLTNGSVFYRLTYP